MNDDGKSWNRFARTVTTVTASSLAREELRGIEAGAETHTPSEDFIALAAASDAPRHRIELRNARRNLTIVLTHADGGVEVEIAASGFASIRDWGGARALLGFSSAGVSTTLTFDDQGRAAQFIAGADITALGRDTVSLNRI